MNRRNLLLWTLVSSLFLSSCQSMVYSAYEAIGVEKRDLLVKGIRKGQEEQVSAQEQFQSTLDALKELTGNDGGDLGKAYEKLKSEYERSDARANAVRARIQTIDQVASDMFAEWSMELEQIQRADLRSKSEELRRDTQSRYDDLVDRMKAAEGQMDPLLQTFKDQVLFLKHNLNAQMVSGLEDVVVDIEAEVGALVQDLQQAIDEADEFINDLPA